VIIDPRTAELITGVPVATIQRWVLRGWITDHGDGQHIRVNAYDIAHLANQHHQRTRARADT
jgi:hypothetical protein